MLDKVYNILFRIFISLIDGSYNFVDKLDNWKYQ